MTKIKICYRFKLKSNLYTPDALLLLAGLIQIQFICHNSEYQIVFLCLLILNMTKYKIMT